MSRIVNIELRLSALKPHYLEIIDESEAHANHKGNDGSSETHILIKIAADSLTKLSKINQHRLIKELLAEEFKTGLHALSIKIIN